MKETIAFELMKRLKAEGRDVAMDDQPKTCKQRDGEDGIAILGGKGLDAEAVKACTDIIRSRLLVDHAPYTIETAGNKNRFFPGASFAAW